MRISDDFSRLVFNQIIQIQNQNQEKENYAQSIRALKPVFESIFKNLTCSLPQAFSSSFSRIVFVADALGSDSQTSTQIYSFRNLAARVSKQTELVVQQNQYLIQLGHLCMITAYFSEIPVPELLSNLYKNLEINPDEKTISTNSSEIENISCVVMDIKNIQINSQGSEFFGMICRDESGLGTFNITVWQTQYTEIKDIHSNIFKYCNLYISHLKQVVGTPNSYQTNNKTKIVLEPDFLIDVTDIAECFQKDYANPSLFFLSKLIGFDGNAATLKGKIVNDILDGLIYKPDSVYNQLFSQSLVNNLLQSVSVGFDEIKRIYESIEKEHLPGLTNIVESYKNLHLRIEPTFISADYGMQGRLDVLIEYTDAPLRKEIFELKSGKPPQHGAWRNNAIQVVAYNMLLRSAYGPGRLGSSSIFYSAANQYGLRNITDHISSEHELLSIRNQIVSILYAICRGEISVSNLMNPYYFGLLPDFKKHELSSFYKEYEQASQLEQLYYDHFLAFCLREHQSAKIGCRQAEHKDEGGFAGLWRSTLTEKQSRFEILHSLKLSHVCPNTGHLHLIAEPNLQHNFRQSDSGIIYSHNPNNPNNPNALSGQILKGNIVSIINQEIIFSLRSTQFEPKNIDSQTTWIIEHDFQESSYWKPISGLYAFLKSGKQRRDLVLGLRMPCINQDCNFENLPNLNSNQNELLRKAILAKDYFLLQGPPGTGKTSCMLVNLVAHTLKDPHRPATVVLAFTNKAVQEICDKLSGAAIDFFRLGNKGIYCDENSIKPENFSLRKIEGMIKHKRVFVSTVAGFATRLADLRRIICLDMLIIDEASQLTEPQIVGLLPAFRKFVLIGDQNQLPAVVSQSSAHTGVSEPLLCQIGLVDLGQSLFERLYKICVKNNWNHAYGMLENHFRMHNQIAEYINPYYQNCLKTALNRQIEPFMLYQKHTENRLAKLLNMGRVLFVETPKQTGCKTNSQEANRAISIIKLIRDIYADRFCSSTIGLISPWRAQVACIQQLIDAQMPAQDAADIQTDTVERFQGGEKDIIIASISIDNPSRLASMESINLDCTLDRKLLVTISRAKEQLIFLGNKESLIKSPFYAAMIRQIEINGGFIDNPDLLELAFR